MMTRQDKLNAIIAAIQTDANLLILLRLNVALNIGNVPDASLDAALQALGIPNG